MKRFVLVFLAATALLAGLMPEAHAGVPYPAIIHDGSFSPNPITPSVGQTISWHNAGSVTHTATSIGPYHLFDTGFVAPAADGTGVVNFAGTFPYECSIHLFKGTASVGVGVTPAGGTTATSFDIQWAATPPPTGSVNHVEVGDHGSNWSTLYRGKGSATSQQFASGTWDIRSRLESKRTPRKKHSGWSPITSVVVT